MQFVKGLLAGAAFAAAGAAVAAPQVDPALPPYQRARGVAGNLPSVGPDTLANLRPLWVKE